jgi:hypothetical protein
MAEATTLPTPLRPSEFEGLIIADDETICASLVKLLKFAVKLWQFMLWMHADGGASGDLSASFKAMICNAFAECDQTDLEIIDNPTTEG